MGSVAAVEEGEGETRRGRTERSDSMEDSSEEVRRLEVYGIGGMDGEERVPRMLPLPANDFVMAVFESVRLAEDGGGRVVARSEAKQSGSPAMILSSVLRTAKIE